jgi:WD40 repeat protein
LELVFHSYHQSGIRGLDIAIQKPLFVSSGDDHTIRLWNYETNTIEQMKYYTEPIYAISMHPSGHQIVVAFASKVSLMNVLIDGFSVVKEFPVHAAHEIKFRYIKIVSKILKIISILSFSNGGHLFAVIDSNIIQIISPIYLEVIHRLNHGQTVGDQSILMFILSGY